MNTADQEYDRLMRLLDVGLDALQRGDADVTMLALKETLETAQRLPQKAPVIALPDRSGEKIP